MLRVLQMAFGALGGGLFGTAVWLLTQGRTGEVCTVLLASAAAVLAGYALLSIGVEERSDVEAESEYRGRGGELRVASCDEDGQRCVVLNIELSPRQRVLMYISSAQALRLAARLTYCAADGDPHRLVEMLGLPPDAVSNVPQPLPPSDGSSAPPSAAPAEQSNV